MRNLTQVSRFRSGRIRATRCSNYFKRDRGQSAYEHSSIGASVCMCTVLALVLTLMLASSARAGIGKLGQACATNADCAVDLGCEGAPRVCRPTEDGATDLGMSAGPTGKEMPPCRADSDCPHGFRCGHGGCNAGNFPCLTNSDCAVGWYCAHRDGISFCRMAP